MIVINLYNTSTGEDTHVEVTIKEFELLCEARAKYDNRIHEAAKHNPQVDCLLKAVNNGHRERVVIPVFYITD